MICQAHEDGRDVAVQIPIVPDHVLYMWHLLEAAERTDYVALGIHFLGNFINLFLTLTIFYLLVFNLT